MKKNQKERKQIHRIVVNALRETLRIHGKIDKLLVGSAAKRIVGILMARHRRYSGRIDLDAIKEQVDKE